MFFGIRRTPRPWRLAYSYIDQQTMVSVYDRFLTRTEAEQRFARMRRHHARLLQPVVQAYLTGPHGFRRELVAVRMSAA